jgi:hypothetical protein
VPPWRGSRVVRYVDDDDGATFDGNGTIVAGAGWTAASINGHFGGAYDNVEKKPCVVVVVVVAAAAFLVVDSMQEDTLDVAAVVVVPPSLGGRA